MPVPSAALERSGVGVIVPSVNRVLERDWRWAWPEDVPYFVTRAHCVLDENAAADRPCPDALRAAEDLAAVRPRLGLFAFTLGGFGSPGANEAFAEALGARMGCPVITAATALLRCLAALRARTVTLVTPYPAAAVAAAASFFATNGFAVTHACGMGIVDGSLESEVDPDAILAYAVSEAAERPADAVVVSCTNYRAWEVAAELERRLGCPVVTSNQALAAVAMQRMGLPSLAAPLFGRLFASYDRLPRP